MHFLSLERKKGQFVDFLELTEYCQKRNQLFILDLFPKYYVDEVNRNKTKWTETQRSELKNTQAVWGNCYNKVLLPSVRKSQVIIIT